MGLSDLLIYDGTTPLPLILWAIYIGIAIATIASYIVRDKYGKFIITLIEKGATTPENAVMIDDLDIKGKFFIKLSLKNHSNYKDSLVAITPDGKYYANYQYTDEPPVLKKLTAIIRQRRTRFGKKPTENKPENDQTESENIQLNEVEALEAASENDASSVSVAKDSNSIDTENENDLPEASPNIEAEIKRERVRFSPSEAKYYVPTEVLDKVRSIYTASKTKLWMIILILIGSAILTAFAIPVIEQILSMLNEINQG